MKKPLFFKEILEKRLGFFGFVLLFNIKKELDIYIYYKRKKRILPL